MASQGFTRRGVLRQEGLRGKTVKHSMADVGPCQHVCGRASYNSDTALPSPVSLGDISLCIYQVSHDLSNFICI
jgi:hypothetical protein